MINFFPFTNFHELNADWILKKVKEIGEGFISFTNEINRRFSDFTTENTKKVNDLSVKIDKEIEKIPDMVETNSKETLNQWKTDGTFDNIIESTYGAVKFLDNISGSKIVVLGDSLSDTKNSKSWILEFNKIVANSNITLTSYAVAGNKLSEQKKHFDSCTIKPDILLIWCGINDVRMQTPLNDIITSLDGIRTKANALNPKCQIYLMSTYKNKCLDNIADWTIPQTAYWRLYSAYATRNGWTFIDAYSSAPIISTETEALRNAFYVEKEKGYLHYTENYSKIIAEWILQIFISKSPVPLGDYKERISGSKLTTILNPTSYYKLITANSYIMYGTRSIHLHLAGTFTAPNNQLLYTKICSLPDFLKPATGSGGGFTMAYEAGGISASTAGGNKVTKCNVRESGDIALYNLPNGESTKNTEASYFFDYYIESVNTDLIYK